MSEQGYILDASALLALMLGEPGADRIEAALPTAQIGAVNLSEVIAKLQERGVPEAAIDESLADLDLPVVPFDAAQAIIAGKLRVVTRAAGLSLGDRACLALAAATNATALTTDRAWAAPNLNIAVEVAR
jgi:ribonuclease VapC